MSSIEISNASVTFPLYNMENMSIRHLLTSAITLGRSSAKARERKEIDALIDVNLNIKHGERVCFLGQNGSGKSTLLRMVAGVYKPKKGSVYIEGSISTLIDPTVGIDPEASGIENIFIRSYFLGKTKSEVNSKLKEIIEFSELEDFINLPVRMYSSGMVMRLAFSILTSYDPDILLLDEWLSVGDPEFRKKAASKLNDYVARAGILLLATNDPQMAEQVATRIITLKSGKVSEDRYV